MPAPNGPQWYEHWQSNIENARDNEESPRWDSPTRTPEGLRDWINSSVFSPSRFPTTDLRSMDENLKDPNKVWDANPEIRKRQQAFKRPKGAPGVQDIDSAHPNFLHEQMKGTGVPSHVTVYHHGDIPKNAEYASGSVNPKWSEEVRSGWRSKDPSINRGRLHIYLVPHEDILGTAGVEDEVFFRRGQPLRKTPRTNKQQRSAEFKTEEQFPY
jgi:hypothetical protein